MILSKSNLGSLGKLAGACCYIPPPQENKIYQYRPIAPLQKKTREAKTIKIVTQLAFLHLFGGLLMATTIKDPRPGHTSRSGAKHRRCTREGCGRGEGRHRLGEPTRGLGGCWATLLVAKPNKTIHNWLMRPFLLANETDVPSPISVGKKYMHSS